MHVGVKVGLLISGMAVTGAVSGFSAGRAQASGDGTWIGPVAGVATTALGVGAMATASPHVSMPALAGVGLLGVGVATAALFGAHELGVESATNAAYPAHAT